MLHVKIPSVTISKDLQRRCVIVTDNFGDGRRCVVIGQLSVM